MSDFVVTLSIPEYLYDRACRLAEEKALPIEQVLVNQLEATFLKLLPLPADEQAELEALTHLSDHALRTIAHEQMSPADQQRMQDLMTMNNLGTISVNARDELTALVDDGQRLMLRKAKALALLTSRGYSIRAIELGDTYRWVDDPASAQPPEHYGWALEIDPLTGKAVKHTALGRFLHEAISIGIGSTGKAVIYMTDDDNDHCLYKFISKNNYDPKNRDANMKLFEAGTLYVAAFRDGEWIPVGLGRQRRNAGEP